MTDTQRREFSSEVAEDHLKNLLDFYDIDYEDSDDIEVDSEILDVGAELKKQHGKLIRAIMKGRVEIVERDDGAVEVLQHLDRPSDCVTPLVYHEMTGAVGMVASKKKVAFDDFHKQILCTVAGLTQQELKDVLTLKGRDHTLMKALGLLFFAA